MIGPETLASLEKYTLAVKEQVSPDRPYAIGLRLSDLASRQLSEPRTLDSFRRWLQQHHCYVFTINGFPFGQFHGTKVKERVYLPDWTHPERLAYTNRLFDLLAQLVPEGIEGSVSTLPGSFKEFITTEEQRDQIREHLWHCIDHMDQCSLPPWPSTAPRVEPEPLGSLRRSAETVGFFQEMERIVLAISDSAPSSASITTPATSRWNTKSLPMSSPRFRRKASASAKFI